MIQFDIIKHTYIFVIISPRVSRFTTRFIIELSFVAKKNSYLGALYIKTLEKEL